MNHEEIHKGISNIITNPGDVNTDFADVRNAMAGQGNAIFGIGIGEGENRATDAAYNAIHNPMLENSKIDDLADAWALCNFPVEKYGFGDYS